MAGCTICPVLSEQMSPARWLRWPENASPLPPSTPASPSSSPLMCLFATHTTARCPTVHPRTTSSSTSAWAGRRRVHGKGLDPLALASCVSFLLSFNAGQRTGLRRFLRLDSPKSQNYRCWGKLCVWKCCNAFHECLDCGSTNFFTENWVRIIWQHGYYYSPLLLF